MAVLSGDYLLDASGNRLLDASSNLVTQDGIQVLLSSSGLLLDSRQTDAPIWEWLKEQFPDPLDFIGWIEGMADTAELEARTARLLGNWEGFVARFGPETHSYQSVDASYEGWTLNKLVNEILSVRGTVEEIADQFPITVGTIEWPTNPPAWYTAPSSVDYEQIAGDVWGYPLSFPDMKGDDAVPMVSTILRNVAASMQWRDGYEGILLPDNQHFRFVASDSWYAAQWLGDWTATTLNALVPQLDLSLVQEDDTLWSYLTREYAAYDWLRAAPGSHAAGGRVYLEQTPGGAYFVCTLTDADIRAAAPSSVSVTVTVPSPPITDPTRFTRVLGTPIPFTAPFIYSEDCDGLIYTVATHGPSVKGYVVEDRTALTGAGVVGFINDTGEVEKFQYLNWDTGVVLPMTMPHAAGFVFSSNRTATGTVTPFTLEPIT